MVCFNDNSLELGFFKEAKPKYSGEATPINRDLRCTPAKPFVFQFRKEK